ncbi:MAG: TIGR02270 family protein, partial [Gammaproteobacteria bacterium]|nr:TIGR02270 family protein [Gammaproteobacteria bacterium]
ALNSSDYNLTDLETLDSRLEANIDGLYIAGEEGWPHYEKHLEAGEYGEIFVISVIAIKLHNNKYFQLAFEMAGDDEELLNAIADAFIWLPYSEVASYLDLLYNIKKPEKQFVAIAASAGHRQINHNHLADALSSSNIMLLTRAILACAEVGDKSLVPKLKECLIHEENSVQFAAYWTMTRFGYANAMNRLTLFLPIPLYAERAMFFEVMQKDTGKTVSLLRQLFQNPKTKRLSIFGMGLLGNPVSIDFLIKIMHDEELARVAGEAFSFITGVDIEYEDLDMDEPEGFEGGPNDNPKDENVDMDRDEDLPWPNPDLISQWWQENKKRFHPEKKYILGKEISIAQFEQVLIHGTQIQREFAALSIAARQQNESIFNTKAPAKRQIQLLGI